MSFCLGNAAAKEGIARKIKQNEDMNTTLKVVSISELAVDSGNVEQYVSWNFPRAAYAHPVKTVTRTGI